MHKLTLFKPLTILAALGLAACTGASSASHPSGPLSGSVLETIDGRQVESLTLRHPTSKDVVVFEAGARNTLDKWGSVPQQVAFDATVFAYHRPGYGRSEPAATPRDGRTIVEELRRVLRHKGLRPPYVLVGHSLGGLYMQLFARAYPDEVKGLVLVDALYPGTVKRVEEFPLATRLAGRLILPGTVWREIEHIDATGEMVLALGPIDDKPIVRLVNQPLSPTAIAVDFGAFRVDDATRKRVRVLYPKAVTRVADSSHQMAVTSPELVVAAVREVMAAAARTGQDAE